MAGWADSSLWAYWGSSAAEERKHWPSCHSELTKERNPHGSKCHQYYKHWFFGWLFLALHCLSPSYHFFLPAPKVKWEAAARSLLRAPFLRGLAVGRALPSPPAWWPTALTFRARCQPHLLTQAFANKGSSPCIALSFEDASSFTYFLLLPNIWCWNSWIHDGGWRGSPDGETSDSCIHIRPFSLQQILTTSNMKNAYVSAHLALSQEIPHWVLNKMCISLLLSVVQKAWRQLTNTTHKSECFAGKPRQAGQWGAASIGKNLQWRKSGWTQILTHYFVHQKKKNQADLFSPIG